MTSIPLGGEATDPYRAPNFIAATVYALIGWGLIALVVFVPWAWVAALVVLIVVALVAIRHRGPLS